MYGDTSISMLAVPYNASDAENVSGGIFTTLVFTALTDINTDTEVSVSFSEMLIYTEGEADNWVDAARIAVNVEVGGVYPS